MRTPTNGTASKVVGPIAVWFVVFLILVFGGSTFSLIEDWRWTTLGGLLLSCPFRSWPSCTCHELAVMWCIT